MIESVIVSLLNADPTLTALVSGRIYPLVLPESPTLPAVTYQVISSIPTYTLDGALGLVQTRIEVNAWGDTYASCKAIDAATRDVLEDLTTATIRSFEVVNSTDHYESDARLYRVQTDYRLAHSL